MGNRKKVWVEVGSILVFALGLFGLAALISYRSTDPVLNSPLPSVAHNWCGRVGATVADHALEFFGIGAFLLPSLLFYVSVTLHKRESSAKVMAVIAGMTVAVAALTVFLSLQWKYWPFGGKLVLSGGAFGTWVADWLYLHFNFLGSSIVTLLLFLLALVVSTPVTIAGLAGRAIRIVAVLGFKSARLAFLVSVGVLSQLLRSGFTQLVKEMRGLKFPKFSLAQRTHGANAMQELIEANLAEGPESESSELSLVSPAPSPAAQGAQSITILPREVPKEVQRENAQPPKPPLKALLKASVGRAPRSSWKLPTIEFLKKAPPVSSSVDRERLISNSQILRQKFKDFGIDGEVTAVRPGPVITLYEFRPGPGVKVSRIAALADDLSMALSAQSVRILAPLPGKSVVGIEIPSEVREMVYLREFLQHPDFYGPKHSIPVVMGKEIGGQTYLSDLARMPHLLCAGQTGSGKSVFMNGLICSLFYRFTPDELRMILVDPKFIEFRAYQDIPHLLLPVVDDAKQASTALKWAVREMDRRYRILAKIGARNLASFNQKVEEMGAEVIQDLLLADDQQSEGLSAAGTNDWMEAFELDEKGAPQVGKLPYIVVIIDELADLMMIAKKEVEISIARIAQKARAAGIHLIIATQRPSTDVITGLIKANLPSRVSFQLASYVDSKTILDRAGAERLLGQGDMLFIPPGVSQTIRLHGAFLDDDEIHKITAFLKSQGKPTYRDEILLADDEDDAESESAEDADPLFDQGVELVKRSGHASASFLQRHLKIGYNRAARMIETMEARGIVGPQEGARPREVLLNS